MNPNKHLPAETAKLFEVINWKGGHRQVSGKFGIIDLTKIDVAKAEKLISKGFTKLRRLPKKAKSSAKPETDT